MKASGGLKDINRDWALKAAFICSSLAAMYAQMLYSDTADPSYIIDVLVSMEPHKLEAKDWCSAETIRAIFANILSG